MLFNKNGEGWHRVYVKKALHVGSPGSVNNHFAKNPFFKSESCYRQFSPRSAYYSPSDLSPITNRTIPIRRLSGFKAELKNKYWELYKIPQPQVDDSDSITLTVEQSEECKSRIIDSIYVNNEKYTPVPIKQLESYQSTFEEDVLQLQASMEYKKKMNDDIGSHFNIIKDLPLPTDEHVAWKKVSLPKPKHKTVNKTLFLSLNGTIIATANQMPTTSDSGSWRRVIYHSTSTGTFKGKYIRLRPGVQTLLKELCNSYEIIVFTSEEKNYATEVLRNVLDPLEKYVDYLLTKDHCIKVGKHYIKDLRIIANRELKDMVLLDKSIVSFCAQMNNGIFVSLFKGSSTDNALFPIITFLKELAKVKDARKEIRRTFFISDLYEIYLKERQ